MNKDEATIKINPIDDIQFVLESRKFSVCS